jgi:hypothetical protein
MTLRALGRELPTNLPVRALLCWRTMPQANPGATSVLIYELDAGCFERSLNGLDR